MQLLRGDKLAGGGSIGKAYIQIIPSADGFKSKLTSAIGGDVDSVSESAGSKGGAKFGEGFSKALAVAGKAIAVSFGAILTGVAKLTQEVIKNYSEYEQLVGGVETLFGAGGQSLQEYANSVGLTVSEAQGKYSDLMTAQQNVMNNANEAYKTAGMSANEYMQTVTSFSASLISSLDGDTVKASQVANQAIIDMSDNANKMGTDISLIQNAYQGFAKQNYTMLDNLKLGYGGTKTEMERLIADANKVKEANGEMADLSIDSFADVVEAIHTMQDEMGVSGTTAKEAEKTIQGSLNSLKASWANLVTGLGDSNADIKQLVQNVVDSFMNLVKNVTPIITAIAQALPTVFQTIGQLLPSLVQELLPPLIQAIMALIQSVITSLPTIFPMIMNAVIQLVMMLVQNIGQIVSMIIELIIAVIVAIAENIDVIIPELVKGIIMAVYAIITHIPEILVAIGKLLLGIFQGMLNLIIEGAEWIFENVLKPVGEFFANLWDKIVEWFVNLIDGIGEWFAGIIASIVDFVTGIWNDITTFFSNLWATVSTWFSNLIKGIGDWFKNIASTIGSWISERIQAIGQFFSNIWNEITNFFTSLPSKISTKLHSAWNTVTSWAKEKIRAVGQWAGNIVSGIWNGIRDKIGWIKNKIAGWVDDVLGWFKNLFGIHSPSTIFYGYGEFIDIGFAQGIDDAVPAVLDSVDDMGDAVNSRMADVLDDVSNTTLGINSALPAQMAIATELDQTLSGTATLNSTLDVRNEESARLEQILLLLGQYLPDIIHAMASTKVVLDSGQTVGGLINEIDRQLGNLNTLKERGAYV